LWQSPTTYRTLIFPTDFQQVNNMTSHIAKLFQLVLTTCAICPIVLTLNLPAARAEAPDRIGELHDLTEKIARNPLQPAVTQSLADNLAPENSEAMV
jgi:hypothetical protein